MRVAVGDSRQTPPYPGLVSAGQASTDPLGSISGATIPTKGPKSVGVTKHSEYFGPLARLPLLPVAAAVFMAISVGASAAPAVQVSFDDVSDGKLPQGWTAAATNPTGPLAHWTVVADPAANSPPNVVSLTQISDRSGGHFNLAWAPGIRFQNGEIEVAVRADSGRGDQGGGPMWRVRDANNYYVARYNPLENNFRIYYVQNGRRIQLASAENVRVATGQWLTVRIVHNGFHIEGWIDGQRLLEFDDGTFPDEGGVGLWTKADAATSFDDLIVRTDD